MSQSEVAEGDVVLASLPQADGTVKNRPAIALREMPPYHDLLLCGLSTQLRQQVPDFDEILSPGDVDYESSGVVETSLVRLGFLGLAAQRDVIGVIGAISPERHKRLLKRLSDYLLE
jgi:mRNA interferase MazF